LTKKSLKIPKG